MEVLFWGVRELRRVQLLSVDRPKADFEVGGITISSKRIEDAEKNCNFEDNVFYADVDLPDNKLFWPPIIVRVVDCRQFGREVLVGTHTIGESDVTATATAADVFFSCASHLLCDAGIVIIVIFVYVRGHCRRQFEVPEVVGQGRVQDALALVDASADRST